MMDDTLRYVVHQLDGSGDIISLPRTFLKGCVMRSDQFKAAFLEFCQKERTQEDAYWATEDIHLKLFGSQRYSDFNSFKVILSKSRK